MNITITFTLPEAEALKHALQQCLHLADRSPNIAHALGITPEVREQAERAVERIQLPRRAHQSVHQ